MSSTGYVVEVMKKNKYNDLRSIEIRILQLKLLGMLLELS